MITACVRSSDLLDLDHLNARRLMLPLNDGLQIALVGCGGTGSWLAPHLVRLVRLLSESTGVRVDLRFVDPDTVEAVNCYRQNFCEAEIGLNKAQALARRYGTAWGVDVRPVPALFSEAAIATGAATRRLIIGCVDNAAGRRAIEKTTHGSAWWMDCGNHHSAGQVLLGIGGRRPDDPWRLPGLCSWLPLPSVQHPELLEDEAAYPQPLPGGRGVDNLSCAESALAGVQGLTVNATVAALAADLLYRLLITKDLTRFAVYVDLESGATRSRFVTPAEVLAAGHGMEKDRK